MKEIVLVAIIVIIIRERETGKSKGYGFIKFDHEDSAKQAITSMNGAVRPMCFYCGFKFLC